MTTPKRRRSILKPGYLITAAAGFLTAVALTHASVLAWALLAALAATVAYMLGRLPPTEFAKRKRAAQRAASTGTQARGWLPPANPDLLPMMVSKACSEGDCVGCPRNGCEHDCRHNSWLIEARNKAEYDEAKGRP